jgi:hypothetical protein
MSITLANAADAHHLLIIFSTLLALKIVYSYGHRGCSAASFWQFQLLVNSKCIRPTVINKITHGRPISTLGDPRRLFGEKYDFCPVYFEINYNLYCTIKY